MYNICIYSLNNQSNIYIIILIARQIPSQHFLTGNLAVRTDSY